MDYIGVVYVIRSLRGGTYGYVFKSYSKGKYTYIPKHKINKHRVLLKHCHISGLPASLGVGINSRVLASRVEMSEELSRLIWYLLELGVRPSIIYTTLGMSHKEVEGLHSGYEAFTVSTNRYKELARRLIQRVIEENYDFNIEVIIENVGIKSLRNSISV